MDLSHSKLPDYKALAEFRHQMRRFLRFSEQAARAAGLEPQQHQLLLALKGLPEGTSPTISVLAERLQIEHHSAVELVNRLSRQGLARRYRSRTDRRKVFVRVTQKGEDVLEHLSIHHIAELKSVGPELVKALSRAIGAAEKAARASVQDSPAPIIEARHKTRLSVKK